MSRLAAAGIRRVEAASFVRDDRVPQMAGAEEVVAAVERRDGTELSGLVHHQCPANVTGQPSLSIPCGFSQDGLPIGLQLIGRPFDEGTLLRIAAAYEDATAWHRRRPPVAA